MLTHHISYTLFIHISSHHSSFSFNDPKASNMFWVGVGEKQGVQTWTLICRTCHLSCGTVSLSYSFNHSPLVLLLSLPLLSVLIPFVYSVPRCFSLFVLCCGCCWLIPICAVATSIISLVHIMSSLCFSLFWNFPCYGEWLSLSPYGVKTRCQKSQHYLWSKPPFRCERQPHLSKLPWLDSPFWFYLS